MKLLFKTLSKAFILILVFVTVNGCEGWVAPSSPAPVDPSEPAIRVAALNHPLVFRKNKSLRSGYEHDLLEQFAKDRNHRIQWIPVNTEDEALNLVQSGQADIAAGRISENNPANTSLLLSMAYDDQNLNLVCRKDIDPELTLTGNLANESQLRIGTLAKSLNADQINLLQKIYPGIRLTLVHSSRVSVVLKELVRNEHDCALVDPWEFGVYSAFFPALKIRASFSENLSYHFFLRPHLKNLQSEIHLWFQKASRQGKVSALQDRYQNPFKNLSDFDRVHFFRALKTRYNTYAKYFKRSSREFGLPWQLVAAVAYQESHWYEDAQSFTGVRGLMQLTKQTALHLGVNDRNDPAQSVWGGSKYLRYLIAVQPKGLPQNDRLSLALATYNVGPAHMIDAQNLAAMMGKNPYSWKDLKEVLPLLADPDYLPLLKYGAARGQEPVDFVERVHSFYEILSLSI